MSVKSDTNLQFHPFYCPVPFNWKKFYSKKQQMRCSSKERIEFLILRFAKWIAGKSANEENANIVNRKFLENEFICPQETF